MARCPTPANSWAALATNRRILSRRDHDILSIFGAAFVCRKLTRAGRPCHDVMMRVWAMGAHWRADAAADPGQYNFASARTHCHKRCVSGLESQLPFIMGLICAKPKQNTTTASRRWSALHLLRLSDLAHTALKLLTPERIAWKRVGLTSPLSRPDPSSIVCRQVLCRVQTERRVFSAIGALYPNSRGLTRAAQAPMAAGLRACMPAGLQSASKRPAVSRADDA